MHLRLKNWTVDYGSGPREIEVPHVWRHDVPLTWEGPAIYRTTTTVPSQPCELVFYGASFEADVFINGKHSANHQGIWDAFALDLLAWQGQTIEVEVKVIKNGGMTWPVPNVASGFIPYVYGTFGGLFREVAITDEWSTPAAPPSRVQVAGRKILVDQQPFYPRGVLTWGWYPDLLTPHIPSTRIRAEIASVKALGFNLIKFCLWMPPHEYLERMRDCGLMAWLELPLWLPAGDKKSLEGFKSEIKRIVDQYAHHDNILSWTIGCELSDSTPAGFREELVEYVRERTGCPLIKDNSGGAEMYGGDPREFGTFADFHPYCDTPFYPSVLDSLLPGPRASMPVLLGEFNDYDVCRNLAKVEANSSFWASPDPALNDQGVRWQHDMPAIMARFASEESFRQRVPNLVKTSESQSLFIRKFVQEQVRAREEISGFVVTGWADTPISTSGFVDDWGAARIEPEDIASWVGDDTLFLIPSRMPPWINGGNRPGWRDMFCHWEGNALVKVGLHSESGAQGEISLQWGSKKTVQPFSAIPDLSSREIASVYFEGLTEGDYDLEARAAHAVNHWPTTIVPQPTQPWPIKIDDPRGVLAGLQASGEGPTVGTNLAADGIVFALDEGTLPRPFWREATHEWANEFWAGSGWPKAWHRCLAVSGDRALDPDWLNGHLDSWQPVWMRIDTRTFEELPLAVSGLRAGKPIIVTTLRPFGGLGVQPIGVQNSPAGTLLLRHLLSKLSFVPGVGHF